MEIVNNGGSIKLIEGAQVRNVNKAQITLVEVIKTNIIKIDIDKGALGNIFFPYASVTNPATADPNALAEAIIAMLPSGGGGGGGGDATEAKQDATITILNSMGSTLMGIQNLSAAELDMQFYDPIRIDDSGAGIIYKGYAVVGTLPTASNWAIQRIRRESDVDVVTWANGTRNFSHVWNNREALTYS